MSVRDFDMVRLKSSDLVVGQPLPWTVYDEFGKLLLCEGSIIRTERQREILLKVGLYAQEKPNDALEDSVIQPLVIDKRANPFAEYEELGVGLQALFERLDELVGRRRQGVENGLERQTYRLCAQLQGLCHYAPDALLGAVHLYQQQPYHIRHPLQVAILCELLAERLQLPQERRLSLLAAALTGNVAMNPYQLRLHQQRKPLTPQQRAAVNKHPLQSAAILRQAGVQDPLWLQLVEQHHECLDGSGYPQGLTGPQLVRERCIIGLADTYSAMITPRGYRPAQCAKQSLRELFQQRGRAYDERLTLLFLKVLGLYPPGVYVTLANQELAVVIGRTDDPQAPLVASVRKPDGSFFIQPRRRNTNDEAFRIVELYRGDDIPRIAPPQLWGIEAIRLCNRQPLV